MFILLTNLVGIQLKYIYFKKFFNEILTCTFFLYNDYESDIYSTFSILGMKGKPLILTPYDTFVHMLHCSYFSGPGNGYHLINKVSTQQRSLLTFEHDQYCWQAFGHNSFVHHLSLVRKNNLKIKAYIQSVARPPEGKNPTLKHKIVNVKPCLHPLGRKPLHN